MRVALVQPPRRYWPYVSEGDNYMLPQALPALAAVLRAAGHEVTVVDCLPIHMGWRSLAAFLKQLDPQVVGCGENHALWASEALRFFKLCREVIPGAVRVAGGAHFTNLWHRYLGLPAGMEHPQGLPADPTASEPPRDIDVVVIGEGEVTFRALCDELERGQPDLSRVDGIAWRQDGQAFRSAPRALVDDLDDLPMPAYDLVPIHLYGTSRYLFSPQATTIHHSRGCTSQCSFCAWWTTMAERGYDARGRALLRARWRTKSPERTFAELELLYRRYDRQAFVWVDESWNISTEWSDAFADRVLRSGMKPRWMAFFRADGVVRDEENGVLEKLVRAGLAHVLIGVERAEDETLRGFNKRFYQGGVVERALGIFKRRYPQVFLQGTFIVGVKDETPESLRRQADLARRLDIDFPAFHPITPVPGTPIYDEAIRAGRITEEMFDEFDWLTPVLDSDYMTRDEIAEAMHRMNETFVNPRWLARGLLSRTRYKRDMYVWFTLVSARMAWEVARKRLNPFEVERYQQLVTPRWYES
jgi:radical SAM superfamily enzyme YgiQ (UPF0313 family)